MENDTYQKNYILTKLGDLIVVFPNTIIAEILLIESNQFLSLPFYSPSMKGCIHHQGKIVPLVSLSNILKIPMNLKRKLTVILLNEEAKLGIGIGVVVERILGNKSPNDLPPDLFQSLQTENMRLFQVSMIDEKIWQPQRFAQI